MAHLDVLAYSTFKLMAHLDVLAYSTFKFANSRGYDRARHAGKKWRGEIDHPWERGWLATDLRWERG